MENDMSLPEAPLVAGLPTEFMVAGEMFLLVPDRFAVQRDGKTIAWIRGPWSFTDKGYDRDGDGDWITMSDHPYDCYSRAKTFKEALETSVRVEMKRVLREREDEERRRRKQWEKDIAQLRQLAGKLGVELPSIPAEHGPESKDK